MGRTVRYLFNEGIPITFTIFYCAGLALFFIPLTNHIFILSTPYTLVLVAIIMFSHHKLWNMKTIGVFSCIFILSFLTEIVGVATGMIFGSYTYGQGLGIKIAEVPVIIGLNWVFLTYASNSIVSKYTSKSIPIVIGAALLMVCYDILLEKVAPSIDMWVFSNNEPPVKNYLVWFLMALIFNWALQKFEIDTENKCARWLFLIQLIFFAIIASYIQLV